MSNIDSSFPPNVEKDTTNRMATINTSMSQCKIGVLSNPPSTPILASHHNQNSGTLDDNTPYSVEQTLKRKQYIPIAKIANSLQGSIWKATKNKSNYIVKVTNKLLHKNCVTNWNGHHRYVSENVIKEAKILKYLTRNNPPQSLVKYVDFVSDKFNYIFVQQYGGKMSLFECVKSCHQYIKLGLIAIKEWQKFCKIAMKQMADLVDWLHNTMNCCHLDISLENFVIDNMMVVENSIDKTITILPNFQIRIIDFGLAEVFDANDFRCNKFVGKRLYKAPEVYNQKEMFDARSADCWSLSVVYFIMVLGCPPWSKPAIDDMAFNFIMNGHLYEIIVGWDKYKMITSSIFNLLVLLFQGPKNRLTIKEIKRHSFLL